MSDQSKRQPAGDLGPDEPTRRCPDCQGVIRRRDELARRCPGCGSVLVSLAWLPRPGGEGQLGRLRKGGGAATI